MLAMQCIRFCISVWFLIFLALYFQRSTWHNKVAPVRLPPVARLSLSKWINKYCLSLASRDVHQTQIWIALRNVWEALIYDSQHNQTAVVIKCKATFFRQLSAIPGLNTESSKQHIWIELSNCTLRAAWAFAKTVAFHHFGNLQRNK